MEVGNPGSRRLTPSLQPPASNLEMNPQTTTAGVQQLAELIRSSKKTVALTGAGISVPSGIPDFRTPGTGLWAKVDPMKVATIEAFHRDTKAFWDFYRPRFDLLGDKLPEPGPPRARRARAAGAARRGHHPEHRPPAHRRGHSRTDRGPRIHRHLQLHLLRLHVGAGAGFGALRRRWHRDVQRVLRQGQARRRPLRRDAPRRGDRAGSRARGDGGADALRRLVARGLPGGGPAGADAGGGRPGRDRDDRTDSLRRGGDDQARWRRRRGPARGPQPPSADQS